MKRMFTVFQAIACCLALCSPALVADVQPAAQSSSVDITSPITMEVAGANVRDIVDSFGQMTGLKIAVALGIELNGKISISIRNEPWSEVLTAALAQIGLTWELAGDYIVVKGPDPVD